MDHVQAGQMLGPYRIIEQVGQGGMATVYKAYHAAMDRFVAVKILPRQLAESPEFTGRFRQEARVIAHLEHAHILPVHDYGESDGFTYLVMRYLEGGTLKEKLAAGRLPLTEVDRLFSQLADALDYAHGKGVIHRDLKPSNVLLDARSAVFLTDFGIAKLLESDSKYTGTGAMIGTPAYMSPEQAQGLPVDKRTDIYSLGVILYEMVTGRVPFDAETPLAIILKHLNDPLPLPSTLRPGLAPAIETVLLHALTKNPADRFASTADFVAAWKAALPAGLADVSAPASATNIRAGSGLQSAPPSLPPASVVPAAGPASQPPSSPPPAPAAPRGRASRLLPPIGIAAAAVFLLCGAVVCATFAYNQLANRAKASATTGVAQVTATAGNGLVLATQPAGTPAGGERWVSWTDANAIYALAIISDTLVTGGPGGLVGWSPQGEVTLRVTTADGLPGTYVRAIVTDENGGHGFIATDFGLVEFRGDERKYFDASSGLDSNDVTSLALTPDGLVVGTQYSGRAGGGLQVYANGQWQPFPGFPSAPQVPDKVNADVSALLVDSAGQLWVGTQNGVARYDGTNWTRFSSDDGLLDNAVDSLGEVAGKVWVGTDNGAAEFDGSAFQPITGISISPVFGILTARDGSTWVTGGGGAAHRGAGSSNWQAFNSQQLPSFSLYGALEGPDGAVYTGSDHGVVRFADDAFTVWTVPNVPDLIGFGHIIPHPDGENLWFVQEYGPLYDVFNMKTETWTTGPTLACRGCVPLAWDDQERLWAG
ncbi:MAG: protein kinase, partial [Anaerolineales bacterium]